MCVFKFIILGFVVFGFAIMKGKCDYFTIVLFLFNFRIDVNLIKFRKEHTDFEFKFLGKDYKDTKLYMYFRL